MCTPYDALHNGAHNILVSTVDSDVIVLLVSVYYQLQAVLSDFNVWVGCGAGNHFTYYDISLICQTLGDQKSRALPFFHAFTGCNTTSQFLGKGKKSAWESWKAYPEVSEAFLFATEPAVTPSILPNEGVRVIHVCVLYDKTTSLCSVNELRKELFCK